MNDDAYSWELIGCPSLNNLFLYFYSLESRAKSVYIESPREVNIQSRAGQVKVAAYGVISIHAQEQLSIDSRNVHLTGLQDSLFTATQQDTPSLQVSSTSMFPWGETWLFRWLICLIFLSHRCVLVNQERCSLFQVTVYVQLTRVARQVKDDDVLIKLYAFTRCTESH